ncbi:DUF2177 domain-containing protein [Candidatus Kaiserbacteria bacterium CG10_big_fil_rev_8_21_14_0_10_45_20]|uniref:DUF2177 domain-containing protein n=1 Tax=Candidatus Kaiserbacteria bacterium CG10_big_fil_rev_8_21_14_0_10_45_20 TaxID=1974607 RepID=A0A2H0UG51_9BACT|nr:MAG: DUF2177 domain-containing protein [Candidatus Kaiserbacteria bacterium CG10_big_fil_rev_8_21_14_0_10_45_20]
MTLIQSLYLFLFTTPVFFIIDMVWLGVIARGFYQSQLADFLGPVNWVAAIIFYLIFIVGILVFAVLPGIEAQSLVKTVVLAGLFGFIAYATYDLTNLATLEGWPLSIVIVDMVWGAVLSATVATASYYIAQVLFV